MADKKQGKAFDKKAPPIKPVGSALGAEILLALLFIAVGLLLVAAIFSPEARSEFFKLIAKPFAYLKMVATIATMAGILISVYSFMRITEIRKEETIALGLTLSWEHERTDKNERWVRVEGYMKKDNPSDWKMAILEADNILDNIVERMGYRGETLGERMKMIEESDFPYLNEAWKAHKLRNEIAHKAGVDFTLSRTVAEQTINIYYRIFKELGYL